MLLYQKDKKKMAFHKKRILMALQNETDSERNKKREEKVIKRNYSSDEFIENDNYLGDDESQDNKIIKKRIIDNLLEKNNMSESNKISQMKKCLRMFSRYLGDYSKSALKISISDYSKKNEDLIDLLDSHLNILNFVYDIMELIGKTNNYSNNDQYVPSSERSEINNLFWDLINYNCVSEMIIDMIDEKQELDPDNEIRKEIYKNNRDYVFPISFIIFMCKSLRHICAFEMLLNPLIL